MRQLVVKAAPELVGVLGAIFFGVWAWTGAQSVLLSVFLALLSGSSLFVSTWVAAKFREEGKKQRADSRAIVAGVLACSTTGLIVKLMGMSRQETLLLTVLFWSGVTVGLAMGTYGAHSQSR